MLKKIKYLFIFIIIFVVAVILIFFVWLYPKGRNNLNLNELNNKIKNYDNNEIETFFYNLSGRERKKIADYYSCLVHYNQNNDDKILIFLKLYNNKIDWRNYGEINNMEEYKIFFEQERNIRKEILNNIGISDNILVTALLRDDLLCSGNDINKYFLELIKENANINSSDTISRRVNKTKKICEKKNEYKNKNIDMFLEDEMNFEWPNDKELELNKLKSIVVLVFDLYSENDALKICDYALSESKNICIDTVKNIKYLNECLSRDGKDRCIKNYCDNL